MERSVGLTSNRLQPWILKSSTKSINVCTEMVESKKCLIELFKCMDNGCPFSTNHRGVMERHLTTHIVSSLPKQNVLSCPYCETTAKTVQSLINHVEKEHTQCRFQCLFCFYRAFDVGNVINHQKFYHLDMLQRLDYIHKPTVIVLPNSEGSQQIDYLIEICTSFQNNHQLLRCPVCSSTHASIALFDGHIKSNHQDIRIACPVCNVQIAKQMMSTHLYNHRVSVKCLYCSYDCSTEAKLFRHLCDQHCTKAIYFAAKMKSHGKPNDVYVLENFGAKVPASRLLMATFVSGGVLLTTKTPTEEQKKAYGEKLIINHTTQKDLPKIVRVQGGVKLAEAGTILGSENNSTKQKAIEPNQAVSRTRLADHSRVSTAAVGPTVSKSTNVNASGAALNGVLKVVMHSAAGPVVTALPTRHSSNIATAVPNSTTVPAAFVNVASAAANAVSAEASVGDGVIGAAGIGANGSTAGAVSAASVTTDAVVATGAARTSDVPVGTAKRTDMPKIINVQGGVKLSEQGVNLVGTKNTIPTNRSVTEPNRASGIPHVNSAVPKGFGTSSARITVSKCLIPNASTTTLNAMGNIRRNSELQAIKPAMQTKNTEVTVNAATGTAGPPKNSTPISISADRAITLKTQLPVSSFNVASPAICKLKPVIVSRDNFKTTVASNTTTVASNTTTVASKTTTVASNTTTVTTKSTEALKGSNIAKDVPGVKQNDGGNNPTTLRKLVKLTKLSDGSLILNLSATSSNLITTQTIAVSKPLPSTIQKYIPVSRVVPSIQQVAATSAAANATAVAAPTSTILPGLSAADDRRVNNETSQNTTGPIKSSSSALANSTPKLPQEPARSNVALSKGCEIINSDAKAAATPSSSATVANVEKNATKQVIKNFDKPPEISNNKIMPMWDKHGLDLSSTNISKFLQFWDLPKKYINVFQRSLCLLIARTKINETDCFVCGAVECNESFSSMVSLRIHMVQAHLLLKTQVIPCKHCDCALFGIIAYLHHLYIHIKCRFVCFLCRYSHFLLSKVMHHFRNFHAFTDRMLMFSHSKPKLNDTNKQFDDLVVVMPINMDISTVARHINSTLQAYSVATSPKANWHPVQAKISELFKCGFCGELLSNELSLKKHILCCEKREDTAYPCAHCEMRFIYWTHILDVICRHLYFHGEELYECGFCVYKHFAKANVIDHVKKHSRKSRGVVLMARKSEQAWKCCQCSFWSGMQQAVMSHIQDVHDLPGERFMCSLCGERMLTVEQTTEHCTQQHYEHENAMMVEMYHPISTDNNGAKESSERSDATHRLTIDDVSETHPSMVGTHQEVGIIPNTSLQPESSTSVPGVMSAQIEDQWTNSTMEEALSVDDTEIVKGEFQITETNPVATVLKTSSKRKRENILFTAADDYDDDSTGSNSLSGARMAKRLKDDSNDFYELTSWPIDVDDDTVEPQETPQIDVVKKQEIIVKKNPEAELISKDEVDAADIIIDVSSDTDTSYGLPKRTQQNRNVSTVASTSSLPSDPLLCSLSRFQRRASRRMANLTDTNHSRWLDGVCFRCWLCNEVFTSWNDLQSHATQKKPCRAGFAGSAHQRRFRLIPLTRCLYCQEQGTCVSLMQHCRRRHRTKPFVCVDRFDVLKCGLCLYRNGSGDDGQLRSHFQAFHEWNDSGKLDYYEHPNEENLFWALSLGKLSPFDGLPEAKIEKFICGICHEHNGREFGMGMHVAKHVLTFICPVCAEQHRCIKALYYHFLVAHSKEMDLVPPYASECEEHLLDVLMLFQNGLVASKRETQHTSVATLHVLTSGFQRYYRDQLKLLELYKADLLAPLAMASDPGNSAPKTCKSFILDQRANPVIQLTPLTRDALDRLQSKPDTA